MSNIVILISIKFLLKNVLNLHKFIEIETKSRKEKSLTFFLQIYIALTRVKVLKLVLFVNVPFLFNIIKSNF